MYVWKHSKYGKDEYKIYVLRYPIKNYYINILLKTQYITVLNITGSDFYFKLEIWCLVRYSHM